ncbi:nuclear transport factor 2 family protein [Streptomyces sp. NPDC088766]|uniref:nuclear transport factor 2 family protein n=1 Tax=Streptomyces sp. NPDC088766 TaxID=3365893 RepID=UPI0038203918
MTLGFSSVTGLPPMTVPFDEYVQVPGRAFAPFPATHHTITGHVVETDGDRATLHAHVRAGHRVPEGRAGGGPDRWMVAGFYDNEAIRPPHGRRLSSVRLTATHQENAHLSGPAPVI